jgi:hypothetical protein
MLDTYHSGIRSFLFGATGCIVVINGSITTPLTLARLFFATPLSIAESRPTIIA